MSSNSSSEGVHPKALRLKQQLAARLGGLEDALEGFPVAPLMEIYIQSMGEGDQGGGDEAAAGRAFDLVDTCLSNWIGALSQSMEGEVLPAGRYASGLRQRQAQTLDALVSVRFLLLSTQGRVGDFPQSLA